MRPHQLVTAFTLACTLIGGGCVTLPATTSATKDITPIEAIVAASDHPITGTFSFVVKAAGRNEVQWLFLNSELDYRDRRCLTVAIPPGIDQGWAGVLGGDPATLLIGKKIRVTGTAHLEQIWFANDGIRSDKYYYQIHINVTSIGQIEVLQDPKSG